ncbi:MAG: hypothetical protein K2V38_19195 [Gemmataceae bacterium]|nr:hypothetical protein [Gemmataceae bacterium]
MDRTDAVTASFVKELMRRAAQHALSGAKLPLPPAPGKPSGAKPGANTPTNRK